MTQMTLQNLSKILDRYDKQLSGSTNVEQLELLKGLPIYSEWGAESTRNHTQIISLSFNHVIGLPQKNGQSFPLFDYEHLVFNTLQSHKHLWIKEGHWPRYYRVHAPVYGLALSEG